MKLPPKIIVFLALVLAGGLFGCSTVARRSATTVPPDVSKLTITGSPYQTKPKWLDSGGLFYWAFTPDKKRISYEPCCGIYGVVLLKENKSELVFKITESSGIPLDLISGLRVDKSDVRGWKAIPG